MSVEVEILNSLKKSRKVLRCSFSKAANEFEGFLRAQEPCLLDLEVSWDILKTKYEDLQVCEKRIYEAHVETASEEDMIQDMEQGDVYHKRYTELKVRYTHFSNHKSDKVGMPSAIVDENSTKRKFKLPRIEFKCYDGSIKGWLSFWSQFKKVHEDRDIENCDKIEYLLQATVPGTRVRQLVESFPLMSENYEKIIQCMQSRFGREDLQIEVYVRELLKLVLNNSISKQKLEISKLYDQIETQLRALGTLGITADKYAAILFPLIESCLPYDLLRIWQRSSFNTGGTTTSNASNISENFNIDCTLEKKLENLLSFLCSEVENEQRIVLVSEGFGLTSDCNKRSKSGETCCGKKKSYQGSVLPTAAGLLNTNNDKNFRNTCIFCSGSHNGDSCFKAQEMSLEEKKNIVLGKKGCYRCLKVGHYAKNCRGRLKCIICKKSHYPIMCPNLTSDKANSQNMFESRDSKPSSTLTDNDELSNHTNSNANHTSSHIFLPTLLIRLIGPSSSKFVRTLIDTGSQRSYILKSTVSFLGLQVKSSQNLVHGLFGGKETIAAHNCYDVSISDDNFSYTFEVLDQDKICNNVKPLINGPWISELDKLNIAISDLNSEDPIELLLGADVAGILCTGNKHNLECGLIAIETLMGWTVMGKVPCQISHSYLSTSALSLFVNASITDLWELDVLGIKDPGEQKSKEERASATMKLFLDTIIVDNEGRYEVRLPWIDGHNPLPTNYRVAQKRLQNTLRKLEKDNLRNRYNDVFKEWESLNIIEKIEPDIQCGHFLPHRPVLKEGSTTAVRPVFDASCREKDNPSLNHCLEKGPNMIELIPSLFVRFRQLKYGVISDIKKAFLQISINSNDRNFLKFLWVDENDSEIVYRHRRVVFGVNCSPFLLGSTIEYHLSQCLAENSEDLSFTASTVKKLSKSFYVDNCVTSLSTSEELEAFIKEAVVVMAKGQFDLRGWEYSSENCTPDYKVPVLGLLWYPRLDVLAINSDFLSEEIKDTAVTKRRLLSLAQKVFDPIGFTAPVTILPKLLLQQLWEKRIPWDVPVDEDVADIFRAWLSDLSHIFKIKIPRWISISKNVVDLSLHTFSDASQKAYAAVVFCRVETAKEVSVHLLAAKSRVAPIKKLSIPRLELLGANIAARLYNQVAGSLEFDCKSFFWSDSSTVISWIQREEQWATFVFNRVSEIRQLTSSSQWHHLPGNLNPADLPSRGCSAKQLLDSKWWEGPKWLYLKKENWPIEEMDFNEAEIATERRKRPIIILTTVEQFDFWHLEKFSKFSKTVNMIALVFRFIYNIRHPNAKKIGLTTVNDLQIAEMFIFKIIQGKHFSGHDDKSIICLNPFYDESGVLRLKSRISNRNDTRDFRYPVLLPAKNATVDILIMETHQNLCHVGVQGLLAQLREKYWIIGGRRTIRKVLRTCITCNRFNSKAYKVESPPLPVDRVRDAVAFEITGVDFAGPLFLRSGEKAWVCLFTCAVYRAIHLELTLSLSTPSFLQILRRFIARRGRPKVIYSDNAMTFKGADNAFNVLDWSKISQDTSTQRIIWRFNPPTGSWWGGFFERLIGIVKNLLRRILGRACVSYEEMMTILCDCESVVNARPITYLSNDPCDLLPLTPVMFLRELSDDNIPDCDQMDRSSLSKIVRNQQRLREALRKRFRLEYLGQLKLLTKQKPTNNLKVGDVVLVGNDNTKRLDWPIGRISELIPGKDGLVRLVRIKMAGGELLRPVQRLYPLECLSEEAGVNQEQLVEQPDEYREKFPIGYPTECAEISAGVSNSRVPDIKKFTKSAGVSKSRVTDTVKLTRSGRLIKIPKRYL